MKLSTYLKKHLEQTRSLLIDTICEDIKIDGAAEIELNSPPIYQFIDDQSNEVVGRINAETQTALIDNGNDIWYIPLTDLTTDQLLYILELVEEKDYEIFEELEE